MNWIEAGSIEHIHGNHDRQRGSAAVVLLVELLVVYWFSTPSFLHSPGGLAGGAIAEPQASIRSVFLSPVQPVKEVLPEVSHSYPEKLSTESDGEYKGTGASSSGSDSGDQAISNGTVSPDDVRIVSLSPSPTNPLWTGDVINIQANVDYNLTSSDSGLLSLVIQEINQCGCQTMNTAPATTTTTVVYRGRRKLTLNKKIRIPVAGRLDVVVRLAGKDASSERTDGQDYRIMDAGRPATGSKNTVNIVSLLPNERSAIRPGDGVDFEVILDYNLVGELGILRLQMSLGDASPFVEFPVNVKRGQRRLVFRERVQIPTSDPAGPDTIQVKAHLDETDSNGAAINSATDTGKYQLSH